MSRERLMSVLIGPHVSEKSARVSEGANQFVFRVRRDATKPDIKAAVARFGAKVRAAHPDASFYVSVRLARGHRKPNGYDAAASRMRLLGVITIRGLRKLRCICRRSRWK